MFKQALALFFVLFLISIPANAQQISAQMCVNLANIFASLVEERNQGVSLADQVKELNAEVADRHPLKPFLGQKLKEIRQTKKTPEQFAQDFVERCFDARGDISKLMGKLL